MLNTKRERERELELRLKPVSVLIHMTDPNSVKLSSFSLSICRCLDFLMEMPFKTSSRSLCCVENGVLKDFKDLKSN